MKAYYSQKLAILNKELEKQRKYSGNQSWVRLLIFMGGCVASYFAFSISVVAFTIVVLFSFVVLVYFIGRHSRIEAGITQLKRLIQIYDNELQDGKYSMFGNGEQYVDDKHAYTSDLDVFGSSSLFAAINRTVTKEGSDCLAGFLLNQPALLELKERQHAAKELATKVEFKENFLLTFFFSSSPTHDSKRVDDFISGFVTYFQTKPAIRIIAYVLPLLAIIVCILSLFFSQLWTLGGLLLLLNIFVSLSFVKRVNVVDSYVGKQSGLFRKYAGLARLVKLEQFSHPVLRSIQNELAHEAEFDKKLTRLARLSDLLDYRKNMLVGFLLNGLLFWDIHCSYAVERWFTKNRGILLQSIQKIGVMDAYLSLSVAWYNHPDWATAKVLDEYFVLNAKQMAHPLLPADKRVANSFVLGPNGKVVILTGSNMSGKSTFLRTIGANMLLAYAGAPVCAEAFSVSLVSLQTYMRTRDSLAENVSSFYAELLRIKQLIEEVERNPRCFLLLDELLKGTNSNDKYAGSLAIVKHLLARSVAAIVATHDLALTDMQRSYPDSICNYHFDITVDGEELFFSYKLREGVCQTFNARLLLKKIGIEVV